MALHVYIDVDRTLVDEIGDLKKGAQDALREFRAKGYHVTLWSSAGATYARDVAKRHAVEAFFQAFAAKPDLYIDDEPASLEKAPCVHFSKRADWSKVSQQAEKHSARIEQMLRWYSKLPNFIGQLAEDCDPVEARLATLVWTNRNSFVKWPKDAALLWEGCVRKNDHANPRCYTYPSALKTRIQDHGVEPDTRSNGPAIAAFFMAGGERPRRKDLPWGWTIHHIYDGRFAAPGRDRSLHAVDHKMHFTHSAGLVALHPIADGLAGHCPLFAWLLRYEAFKRFTYDPDGVFTTS